MSLTSAFHDDVAAAALPGEPVGDPVVTRADYEHLPGPVPRYFDAMAVAGRPQVWSFTTRFAGRFRLGPDKPWMAALAWQYNHARPVTRIYTMKITLARVLPMIGHDTYVDGRGRMLGKLLGLKTVADGSGEPYDIGELTTYLNDAVMLAPSMLLTDTVSWRGIDGRSFDVSLTDAGRTVTARVLLGDDGLPADFSTTDRFVDVDGEPRRCEWRTPIDSWDRSGERPMPGPGHATWLLPEGPFVYAEGTFDPARTRYNVTPGELA